MSLASLLIFAGIYALAVLIPGPGVAAVVTRALTTGARRTAPFIWGIVLGDLVWFCFAAFGLAAMALMLHGLFVAVKYAGAAYLLFIAWKLWTANPAEPRPDGERQDGAGPKLAGLKQVLAGLSLTLGNPKTMVFFLAILPHVVDLNALTAGTFLELTTSMVVIITAALWGYALLAARAGRLIGDTHKMRAVNRGSAVVMAGAAGMVTVS
ncbi:Threonine/homoserine/homoserine lactone efflux protein [Rhizobiales bacterium GAS191]|nr:Threonine/homoserine/homoserine lactone efflux protein [Rhizobiales bacterium GAS191]